MSSSGFFIKGVVVLILTVLAPVLGPLALCAYLLFILIRSIVRESAKTPEMEEMDSTDEA